MAPRKSALDLPPAYRSLLIGFPKRWRDEHGDLILSMAIEADRATGRDKPRFSDRLRFAGLGVRVRIGSRLHPRPRRQFAEVSALATFHHFDQANGLAPIELELEADDQVRANAALMRHGSAPLPQVAWGGIAVRG